MDFHHALQEIVLGQTVVGGLDQQFVGMAAPLAQAVAEAEPIGAALQGYRLFSPNNAVAQKLHPRRRIAQRLYGAPHLEGLRAVHLLRQRQVAEINLVLPLSEADRQDPDRDSLRTDQRQHFRELAAIFVAVGNEQNPSLAPLADLGQGRLERCLEVRILPGHRRRKVGQGKIRARKKLPCRLPAEKEQPRPRSGGLDPARLLQDLHGLIFSLLPYAAGEIGPDDHVQRVDGSKDFRVDNGDHKRRERQGAQRQGIKGEALAKDQIGLDRQQDRDQ